MFVLFSLFILFCGITHVIGIFTIWHGIYGVHGISKAFTALVSVITAIYVYKLMPDAINLPTVAQFEDVKKQLDDEQANVTALEFELGDQQLAKFVLNALPVSTLMLNDNQNIIFSNQRFKDEFSKSETDNLSLFDVVSLPSSVRIKVIEYLDDFVAVRGNNMTIIASIKVDSGIEIPVELVFEKSKFRYESVTLISIRNLTEITQIKHELLGSHERLERAISATEDGIWEWNVKNNSVNYSPKFMELIGKPNVKEPTFDDWLSHIHPAHKDMINNTIEEHFANKKQFVVEYLGRDVNQKYSWFISIGNSMYDTDGKATMMSGSLRNIDLTKNLELLYQEKVEFLEAIFHGSSHAIWVVIVDDEFTFEEYNPTACIWTQVKREQIVGKTLSALTFKVFPEDLSIKMNDYYCRSVKTFNKVNYTESITKNNKEYWYHTTLYPILNEKGEVAKIVGTAIDITQQKQNELELKENKEFLERIINSSVCGLYLYDLKTNRNIQINQRYTDLLGYNIDDLNHIDDLEDISGFYELFHPEDLSIVQQHINEVVTSTSNQLIPVTYRFKHKQGHWVWCHSVDCIVKYNSDNQPETMLGTFVDITEQTLLLQKLKESNDYLERFAFVASHDLQEPLRKITAFSDLLSKRIEPLIKNDEDAKFELSRLKKAAQRMQVMIKDVLRLSRINTSSLIISRCDLTLIIKDVKDQLSEVIQSSNAHVNVEGPIIEFFADSNLLSQLFLNLLTNAIKFSDKDTTPEITISMRKSDDVFEISCEDNGIGINEEYATQIFDPFRRLHSINEYTGSGIGLAICQQIMKVHKGSIRCTSKEKSGCTFVISLPVRAEYV